MAAGIENGQGKSMAIWFPRNATGAGQPSVDLHFNLWRLGHRGQEADKKQPSDLLDIGILIKSPSDVDRVSFYLPTRIDRPDIVDLGPKFSDGALATGIFNEPLTATNGSPNSVIILEKAPHDTYCRVLCFPTSNNLISESDLEVRPEYDGTTITITSTALNTGAQGSGEDLYIRLRITIPKNGANTFINAAIPEDKWFASGLDVTEYLDFRLNQPRNLNPGISRQMVAAGSPTHVPIKRLAFLLVVGVAVDVVVGHPSFHKCRLLERDLWKSYVDEAHLRKGMVIYHWRALTDKHLEDFNAFVKLRLRLSGWRIIKRYLIIALLFGAMAGVLGNTFYDGLKSGYEPLFGEPQASGQAPG